MTTLQPHAPLRPLPTLPTVEEPSVARFLVVPGSDAGFLIPSTQNPLSDLHLQNLDAPGLVRGMPAVLYFRTQYTRGARFQVRVNQSAEFRFTADEAAAKSWHELLSPGVLREEDNEITLFVAPDDGQQVIFSEIAILYTSNKLTITRPIVFEPAPG
jgi:hypothetical protein